MKIAVVTGHYLPEMGYVEVQLARALKAEGHQVRVFTSRKVPPRGRDKGLPRYSTGLGEDQGVEVERLPHRFAFRQIVLPKGLRRRVESYDPELLIAIGIGKLFTGPVLLPPSERSYRLLALLGNSRFNFREKKLISLQKRLVQRIFKDPHYRRAIRNCDQLWCYTPETKTLLSEFTQGKLDEELHRKVRTTSLGFDPKRFYFDEEERREGRQALGMKSDEFLVVTATRLVPSKKLEQVIEAFEQLAPQHPELHYLLIGSSGNRYAQRLESLIEGSPYKDRFRILPFQKEDALRRFFNAADLGLWTKASITVQEAMGTGLPMLLPDHPSLSQLLTAPQSGILYPSGALEKGLEEALEAFKGEDEGARKERMKGNRQRFSDRGIARDLVERSTGSC